jgi:hypothetical protein
MSTPFLASVDRGYRMRVAAFVFQTSTWGLPDSYIVFDNGYMVEVHAWLDEDKQETQDRSEVRYAVFMDGPHEIIFDLDPYTYAHPSWETH